MEKFFALFYKYGVSGKEVDYFSTYLIKKYDALIEEDKISYELINLSVFVKILSI